MPLSKDDKRAIEAATATIGAVRVAQLVAIVWALVDLWGRDWKGALIFGGLALGLSWFLPVLDPGLMKRLRDGDGR